MAETVETIEETGERSHEMTKMSTSTEALSIMLGSMFIPKSDGTPQRRLSAKESYEIAEKRQRSRRQG